MKVNIRPILSGETSEIDVEYTLTIPEDIDGIAFPEPVSVHGKVLDNAGYMVLELQAMVPYKALCARCLEPVRGELDVRLSRPISASDNVPKGGEDEEDVSDEYIVAEDDMLDTDGPFIEQLILETPLRVLCREDCRGLCPKCGKNLNEGSCGCPTKEIDPRLKVLGKLLEGKNNE